MIDFTALDSLIRQGNSAQARAELKHVTELRPARSQALPLASLARRAELPNVALKLLNPIVRPPEQRAPTQPTSAECAEYAASLVKIGAVEEGMALLGELDAAAEPQILIFRAFGMVAKWDYLGSIPVLRAYLDHPRAEEYQKLVVKMNLVAALVYERRHDEADTLFEELKERTRRENMRLLLGNCLEQQAQSAVVRGDYSRAEALLTEAERLLENTGELFGLFVRKARALLEVARDGSLTKLGKVRGEAVARQHWETVRACDRAEALLARDEAALVRLWVGSPYESFRRWLLVDAPSLRIPDEVYEWRPGPEGRGAVLDLVGDRRLKPGQVVHRTLATLASDFYRPFRLAALHSAIYPDEYYNPRSAPLRLHQALNRARRWCATAKIPLEIAESEAAYRLTADAPVVVRVPVAAPSGGRASHAVAALQKSYPVPAAFSMRDATALLGVSPSTALRVLESAIRDGTIAREGAGNRVRYRFV